MTRSIRETRKLQFVEDVGIFFEQIGLTRMSGRVFGLLMVGTPETPTAAEVAAAIGASKGSMSSSIRLLVEYGVIEQLCLPGERSTRYRIRHGFWAGLMRKRAEVLSAFRQIAERGLGLADKKQAKQRSLLNSIEKAYSFLEQETRAMLLRLEKHTGHEAQ